MPVLTVILTLSFLAVLGFFLLLDSLSKIASRKKISSLPIYIYIPDSSANAECIIKNTIKKNPSSKIIVRCPSDLQETKKMLEILKREFPCIFIEFI